MGFIHEGVKSETGLMNEAERLRDLLDGSMDPSELEIYEEYYKLAERIYGREALDEMGISTPVEVDEIVEQVGNSEFTHDVIMPTPIKEIKEKDENTENPKNKRRKFVFLAGILGLIIISANIVVGINSIVDLCEDEETMGEIEFRSTPQVNENTLTIYWTVENTTANQTYTITWDISQNGSQELVESGELFWIANSNSFSTSTSVTVQTEPYAYSSKLLDENGTIIATTNGNYVSSEINTLATIESSKLCEDNPRLKWNEIMNYDDVSLDAWGQTGDGEIIDGMLLMIFAFISLFGLTKKKNN